MAEPPPEAPANGIASAPSEDGNLPSPISKRQRRPSVRLGEIGEQPATVPHESFVRQRKNSKHSATAGRDHLGHSPSSKTRPVIQPAFDGSLEAPGLYQAPPSIAADDWILPLDEDLPISVAMRRGRDAKSRRSGGTGRRGRSIWTSSRIDEGIDATTVEPKEGVAEDAGEEDCKEFEYLRAEDSESPLHPRGVTAVAHRVKVPGTYNVRYGMESNMPEDNGGNWNDQNGLCGLVENGGVRAWLSRLGLDRYAPVFEIHEVDDEVLPWLTMEDLKDMGINAVGSRRKMYCAVQKLKKSLSRESSHEECS